MRDRNFRSVALAAGVFMVVETKGHLSIVAFAFFMVGIFLILYSQEK